MMLYQQNLAFLDDLEHLEHLEILVVLLLLIFAKHLHPTSKYYH
jgi:hypothetical protein